MWLTVLLIFSCFLLFFCKSKRDSVPGPIGLPIIGYYPFLGDKPIVTLQQLANKYGNVMKVKLLGEDYYFLNSMETVKEALVKQADNFMSRPVNDFNILTVFYGKKAYIHAEVDIYKIQKRFLIPKLSSIGMTKTDFQVRIHELAEDLVEELRKNETVTNLGELLSNVASNVIMRLVFNEKYAINDPMYIKLLRDVDDMMESLCYLNLFLFGNLFYWKCRMNFKFWRKLKESTKRVQKFMFDHVKQRAANKEYPTQYNDLVDYCLEESNGPNADCYDFKTLAGIFVLFFVAGTETTATTTFHGITLLAKYPEIQKKLFKELEMFDKDSRIWFSDIDNLHYTRACIAEIQRFASAVPLNLIHLNSESTTIGGQFIPKRSKVVANIWKLGRDKKYFKNPECFDPNNFLDDNGNFVANEANMPFGIGKRRCLGHRLAEIEITILMTKLVRKFKWCAPPCESVKYEVFEGGLRTLFPNKLVAKPRCK